jgi:integrase
MGRLKKDVCYKKRGKYWYYRLKGMENFKTTSKTSKTEAENFVNNLLQKQGFSHTTEETFYEYAKVFFEWEQGPHARRLRDEGKPISKRYVEIQRMNLEKHILPSNLRSLKMNEIKRAHIIDFRSTLVRQELAPATVNKIMSCLKVVFNEAQYREDLLYNPAQNVGNVYDSAKEVEIFSNEELMRLFPLDYKKVWKDELDYTCFYFTALTGMRRGEVLAIRWKHIDFEKEKILIEESWKNISDIGKPKWEKERDFRMSQELKSLLLQFWEYTFNRASDDLVFANADGTRLGETWWKKHFDDALLKAEISKNGRRLRPHSLRHTLNTIYLDNGEDSEKIRAALGWSDSTIQKRYTHLNAEHFENQADIIDGFWASNS